MAKTTSSQVANVGAQIDKELIMIAIFSGIGFIAGIVLGIKTGAGIGQSIGIGLWGGIGIGGTLGYFFAWMPFMFTGCRLMGDSVERAIKHTLFVGLFYLVVGIFAGFFFPLILALIKLSRRKKCIKVFIGEERVISAIDNYLKSEIYVDREKSHSIVNHIVANFMLAKNGITEKNLKKLKVAEFMEYVNNTKAVKPRVAHGKGTFKGLEDIHTHTQSIERHNNNVNVGQSTKQSGVLFDNEFTTAAILKSDQDEQMSKKEEEKDHFTDKRDAKKYRTVKIGNQLWMAENLSYKTDNSWCYDNDESDCKKYGRLYTWDAAKNACPAGWRLPTCKEWDELITTVGGSSAAGKKLKTISGWNDNGNGTDDYGFSALPGGYRASGKNLGGGSYGNWWTATEHDGDNAHIRSIHYKHDKVGDSLFNKCCGFSVRCIQINSGVKTISNASEYVERGRICEKQGDIDNAFANYTEAIRLDPNYADAYCCRSSVYRGNPDGAISDCNEAIRLEPNYTGAYFCRGCAYEEKGDPDRAIADYSSAIRIDPSYALAYWARGNVYKDKGDLNKAISDYNTTLRFDPNYAPAYISRANAYDGVGNLDKAIMDYNEALRLKPNSSKYCMLRGIMHERNGDMNSALADYNDAIRLDPNNAGAYCCRGMFYRSNNNLDKAIADYTKAIILDPNEASAYDRRGWAYISKNDPYNACADFDHAIELEPNRESAYHGRGACHAHLGHIQEAIYDFEKLLSLTNNSNIAAEAHGAIKELRKRIKKR